MPPIRSAELISVGTELLLGEIVDTNSAYLAADLARLGVDVLWSSRVGDNQGRIAQLLDLALTRSDLVIMGGGLGPTDDDLTREAIAAVLGEAQTRDPELERWLR
ncbi:MAG TPA: molybdopterin-binding protein, partial [Trueperaceae bacterium]|nr:molybdopterin-binding protein [Trueperaceae bacterium]